MVRSITLTVLIFAATAYGAERRPQDPTPRELARITAAAPKRATAKPLKPRKMLVLSYQSHEEGRFAGEKALEIMARQTGAYQLTFVRSKEDLADVVVPEVLKDYDAVCVNNSTGGEGNAKNGKTLVENISRYVADGGGLVGIHAATDNRLGEVFGGFFCGHPWSERVGIMIDDPEHPLTRVFKGKGFMIHDEIYQFTRIYSREKLRILLSLDMTKTADKGRREDGDNAVAWVKQHGKGRVFYCSLGHRKQIFQNPKILRFYLDGIQFALGDIKADMTPSGPLKAPRIKREPLKLPASGVMDGYLVSWRYAGPYLAEKPFESKFAPELDTNEKIEWKAGPVGQAKHRPQVMSFDRVKDLRGDHRAVYLRTKVFLPAAQKVQMVMGSDDGIKVWLNGKAVHAKDVTRGLDPASDKVAVDFKKGWNVLLVKVTQGDGDWAACVALRNEDGGKLTGLKCAADIK